MNNDFYMIAIPLASVQGGEVSDKNNESPIVAIRYNYKEIIGGKVSKEQI